MPTGSDENDRDGFPSPDDERDEERQERHEFNTMFLAALFAGAALWFGLWKAIVFTYVQVTRLF